MWLVQFYFAVLSTKKGEILTSYLSLKINRLFLFFIIIYYYQYYAITWQNNTGDTGGEGYYTFWLISLSSM